MSSEPEPDLKLEIAHVLLLDVVGYSKLLVNEQIKVLKHLNQAVRSTPQFRASEAQGKLVRLPTGDGMALLFFDNPESPVQCALEISAALREQPWIELRMGVHCGPIKEMKDVNDHSNFAGAGLNVAQRVLDCGDGGHILLSGRIAEDLGAYERWHSHLQDLGQCEVKHGVRIHLFNLCKDGLGNPALPSRLKAQRSHLFRSRSFFQRQIAQSPRRWLALALSVGALLLVLAMIITMRSTRSSRSIAVLPFENSSDEKGNQYFVDGVHDEIIANLSRVRALTVISKTSVTRYPPGVERDPRDIGKTLGVSYLVEGSVQRVGTHIRVHARLINVQNDTNMWTDHYDSDEADIFQIQSEIAQRIAAQLKLVLSPSDKAAISKELTRDLPAYDNYMRARTLIDDSVFGESPKDKLLKAVTLLHEATSRDPSFFFAFSQAAYAHDRLYHWFDPTSQRLAAAQDAIDAMARLHPEAGETHLARGRHFYWGVEDNNAARRELELAQASLPNDPDAPLFLGFIARREGRWDASTRDLNRALELDPLNPLVLQQIALSYFNLRRFEEMAAILRRASRLSPTDSLLRAQVAAVELEEKADSRPLRRTIDEIARNEPEDRGKIVEIWLYLSLCERDFNGAQNALEFLGNTSCQAEGVPFPKSWCEGVVARLNGREETARVAFTQALKEAEQFAAAQPADGGASCALAMTHAALGHNEDAIRAGRRAVELVPMETDAIDAPLMLGYLAMIYSWAGENDLAIEELTKATNVPSYWSYGNLRLHPYWDTLRADPRFAQIVESLAPKDD